MAGGSERKSHETQARKLTLFSLPPSLAGEGGEGANKFGKVLRKRWTED